MRKLEVENVVVLRNALRNAVRCDEEIRFMHRVHCVLLVANGVSCYRVAEIYSENPRTIERWVRKYSKNGIDGLSVKPRTGRPRKLSDEQYLQLCCEIRENAVVNDACDSVWDGRLLQRHLFRNYGINLGVRQCQRLLRCVQSASAVVG